MTEIQEKLAGFVRWRRTGLKMTLPTLAKLSGVSKATLSKIENGKSDPSMSALKKLATALKIHFTIMPDNCKCKKQHDSARN